MWQWLQRRGLQRLAPGTLVGLVLACVIVRATAASAAPDLEPTPLPQLADVTPPAPPPVGPFDASVTIAPVAEMAESSEAREAMRKICEQELPECDPVVTLGSLERAALRRALSARKLTIDPSPWGKQVGRIHVVTLPVFDEDDSFLDVLNYFHVTTRESVVRREMVLHPGDLWRSGSIEETARILRDPVTTTLAVVVPVKSAEPGKVDVLAVTRDIWSLRMNSNYRFESGTFTFLTLSLSENNFFGSHRLAAAVLSMDLGRLAVGPQFIDKNLAGTHLDVRASGRVLFGRDRLFDDGALDFEGSTSAVSVNRPLWSLDSRWGGGVSFSHSFAVIREFQGTTLRTYDDPATAEDDLVPWRYRQRDMTLTTSLLHGLGGDDLKHRLKVGHSLESQRPTLPAHFDGSAATEQAFTRDVLPRSERNSVAFASYELFEPRYRNYRNISSFDLSEDVQLGLSAALTVGAGLKAIGSEANFTRAAFDVGYLYAFGVDGQLKISGSASVRRQAGTFIDNAVSGSVRMVSPTVRRFRLVAEARAAARLNETQNRFLSLGGDTGLRGFAINQFDGQRRVVGQLELRSEPRKVRFTRWGGVLFYDVGAAADSLNDLRFQQDVGIGLRGLIPQLASELMRIDLAVPLTGEAAGQPRFIAGFSSEF